MCFSNSLSTSFECFFAVTSYSLVIVCPFSLSLSPCLALFLSLSLCGYLSSPFLWTHRLIFNPPTSGRITTIFYVLKIWIDWPRQRQQKFVILKAIFACFPPFLTKYLKEMNINLISRNKIRITIKRKQHISSSHLKRWFIIVVIFELLIVSHLS